MARSSRPQRRTTRGTPDPTPAAGRPALVVGLVVLALAVLAIVAVTSASSDDERATPSSTSTTSGAPTSAPLPTADVPDSPAGDTLTGPTPCPAPDGSSPRVTSFEGPPPVCIATDPEGAIDTEVDYRAVVETSVGPLTYLLNTGQAPETVNNFVVLARYHYWDGAPLTFVLPQGWAELGTPIEGIDPAFTPGYELPGEAPEQGAIFVPGSLAMAPTPSGTSDGGRLVITLGDVAADLPLSTTAFGLLLDGIPALQEIQRSGTDSGAPAQVIVVEDITVEPRPPA